MSTSIHDAIVETRSFADPRSFVEALFSDSDIFKGEDRQGKQCNMQGFLAFLRTTSDQNTTKSNPDMLRSYTETTKSESKVVGFLNALCTRAYRYSSTATDEMYQRRRLWSGAGSSKSLPGIDAHRCPDVFCTDHEVLMDWRLIRTVVELKSGNETDSTIHRLCSERAADLLRVQGPRCFVLVTLIHRENVTVALFDRGGSIISTPFSFTNPLGWEIFVRLILGISYAPPFRLGFDPHITGAIHSRLSTGPAVGLGVIEIYLTAFITSAIHSRGTVVWVGWLESQLPKDLQLYLNIGEEGCPIIIKNSWVDTRARATLTEGTVLSLLSAKGVQGIPRLLGEEAVKTSDGRYYLTTGYMRASLGIKLELSKAALRSLKHHSDSKGGVLNEVYGYENRALLRTYSTPWATPITRFRSALELLGGFYDCITSHEQAASNYIVRQNGSFGTFFPFQILHRDPSIENMGFVPQEHSTLPPDPDRPGMLRGQLLDWGLAAVHPLSEEEIDYIVDGHQASSVTVEPEDKSTKSCEAGLASQLDEVDNEAATEANEDYSVDSNDTQTTSSNIIDGGLRPCIQLPSLDTCEHPPVPTAGLGRPYKRTLEDLPQLMTIWRDLEEMPKNAEITGTRPFMALELEVALAASSTRCKDNKEMSESTSIPEAVTQDSHHDLESFYYCLLVMMLWFYVPHRTRTLSSSKEIDPEFLVPKTLSSLMFSGPMTPNNKFLHCATKGGLLGVLQDELPEYFKPLAPMLQELRYAIFGDDHENELLRYLRQTPRINHQKFKAILRRWIKKIQSDPKLAPLGVAHLPPPGSYPPIEADGRLGEAAEELDKRVPFLQTNTTFVPDHSFGVSTSSTSQRLPSPCLWPRVLEVKPSTLKSRTSHQNRRVDIYAPPPKPSHGKRKQRETDDGLTEKLCKLMRVEAFSTETAEHEHDLDDAYGKGRAAEGG